SRTSDICSPVRLLDRLRHALVLTSCHDMMQEPALAFFSIRLPRHMPSLALHEYRASDTIICSISITQFSEQEIQRDRGCIFRHYPEAGACGGYRKDGALILRADHLNTRARNISYGDVRLAAALANGITSFG